MINRLRPNSAGMSSFFQPNKVSEQIFWGILAFVLPATIYFFYRINIYSVINADALGLMATNPMTWLEAFEGAPGFGGDTYYRPIENYRDGNISNLFRHHDGKYFIPIVAAVGILIGLLSWLIYQICLHFCGNKLTSFFASILYVFSAGSLSGSWYTIWTPVSLNALIFISGAFLSYLQYNTQVGWKKNLWLWSLIFCCLLGPYSREITYVAPAVILILEIGRIFIRRSFFIILPALLFCHALFPKALVSLLGIYRNPVTTWLTDGKFSTSSGLFGENLSNFFSSMLYKMSFATPGFVIDQFPPSLWLCVISAVVIGSVVKAPPSQLFRATFWKPALNCSPTGLTDFSSKSTVWFWTRIVGSLLVGVLFVVTILPLFGIQIGSGSRNHFLHGFLFLFLFLSLARFGPILPLWFLATFPANIMVATNHQAHLGFVVPPLAILCALYCKDLVIYVGRIRFGFLHIICLNVVLVAGIFSVLDHVGNVQTSFMTLNNINTGHQQIAQWILKNIPKGSVIIPDSSPSQEVSYRMDSPFKNFKNNKHDYFWVWNAPAYPEMRTLIDKALKQNKGVYYLHVSSKSTDNGQLVPRNYVKKIASFQVNNLGFEQDPLRMLVDSGYFSRSFVVTEWDNTYTHLGQGESRYIWRTQWEIFKLIESKATSLNESSFTIPSRSRFEAGDSRVPDALEQ